MSGRLGTALWVFLFVVIAAVFADRHSHAQILEVCTVGPFHCEKPGTACTDEQNVGGKSRRSQWSFSCTLNTKDRAPTQEQLTELAAPFVLPRPVPIEWCGSTLNSGDQSVPLDMPTLIGKLASSDYVLTPGGNYVVLVSKTTAASTAAGKKSQPPPLDDLNKTMKLLLASVPANASSFVVELVLPHASVFGSSLLSQIGGISSPFTLRATGRDRIAVSTATGVPPTCGDWKAFLTDVRELMWSVHSEPPETRVTATDAGSMATALGTGTTAGNSPSGSSNATTATTPSSGSGTPAAAGGTTAPSTPALTIMVTSPPAAGAKAANTATAGTTSTTITVAQAPSTPQTTPTPSAATPAAATAGGSTPGVSIGSIEPDLLVFSDASPGDDAQITEKKRVAAILDLPRPEMSISAWVMQNSSTDPDSVNRTSQQVREEVRSYNDGLESTVMRGWLYLQTAMSDAAYFDRPFYDYVARRVIFDGRRALPVEADTSSIQQLAHSFLNEQGALSDPIKLGVDNKWTLNHNREDYLGACRQGEYCLGYTTLFHPIKPRLTDLLLALIAAKDPMQEVTCSVDYAEGFASPGEAGCTKRKPELTRYTPASFHKCTEPGYSMPCEIWRELNELRVENASDLEGVDPRIFNGNCEQRDYLGVLESMLAEKAEPVMFLNCFRTTATTLLDSRTIDRDSATRLGLLRAAIADFLFNYKISQQYPHEFVSYDLTTSAQAMNSAIRPLVDAFVRDVTAYQAVLKRRLGLQIEEIDRRTTESSVFDKPRFFNNAIVTVNTIANSEASVDTTVESYLEALNPPTLSGLAGALSGATGATPSTSTSNPAALNSLVGATRFNEAQLIAAGVSQFASSHIHIGRELSVDVKPESLLGANSAELQVTLKADDEAASGTYSSGGGGSGTDAEISRFGKSDTTTRIRVDSLKLFEVSSFASQLMTPKKRFPILPVPGLEMPYFGSFLSIPLRPAREFHISMGVMSAIVIPTATDLAFSARFVSDRLLAPENAAIDVSHDISDACVWPTEARDFPDRPICRTRPMISLRDFDGQPIREFNRMKTHCLATGGKSATPSLIPIEDDIAKQTCAGLTFRDVLGDVN